MNPAPETPEAAADSAMLPPPKAFLSPSAPFVPTSRAAVAEPSPAEAPAAEAAAAPAAPAVSRWERLRRTVATRQFLFVSILVHLLLGGVATVLVVQTITAKRKLTFTAAPPSTSQSTRTVEHRVQMAQKQKTMSAPVQAKRVTTLAANAKVALPQMPAMPALASTVTPAKMGGMGGVGFGTSAAGAPGGGGGGGGPVPLFGLRTKGKGLIGHLYDLKQDRSRKPTNMTTDKYATVLASFVRGGFNTGVLANYYEASVVLYSTQMFTPDIDANLAPKSFGVEAEVQPRMWAAVYKAKVTPPESGTYHFVGIGDDVLVVKFDGKIVLDHGYCRLTGSKAAGTSYDYQFDTSGTYHSPAGRHGVGSAMEVTAGDSYDMEILIGEQPGGESLFQLLLQKDGVNYQKDAAGNPILPVFRTADTKPPPPPTPNGYPPHLEDGPVWKAEPASDDVSSIFSH